MSEPVKPKDIARFAAEGVAIALRARAESHHVPLRLICGIPAELFEIKVEARGIEQVTISPIEPFRGQGS